MEKIYQLLPHFLQNLLISIFNLLAYQKRYSGNYTRYRAMFLENRTLSLDKLEKIQRDRYAVFVSKAISHSRFYNENFKTIEGLADFDAISKLPIVDKELFRKDIDSFYTISPNKAVHAKTGGTTGKSLEVLFTLDNIQERFAMLDDFRSRFGYELGKKTAWFSGKNLLTAKDVKKSRFWKMDYLYKVRYYSTFHIKEDYLKAYVEDLIRFKPEYIVGFPSSILEIAKYGLAHGYEFPAHIVKAVFPTAETITQEMSLYIEGFFKTAMYNQYASSEGAPFIFECANRKLHLELQSGVFEVLNEINEPAKSGKLVVTSFTTEGTPLIRYDIGDAIVLSYDSCNCGNSNPLVQEILGRIDDFVYSPETGKINLGNVSNTLKDTAGIIKFQAIQDDLQSLTVKMIIDPKVYNSKIEEIFIKNWKDRMGHKFMIHLEYVDDLPNEKSGKFRMVKNNIKHLVNQ